MKLAIVLPVLFACSAALRPNCQASSISTLSSWNGFSGIGFFGSVSSGDTSTFGETITATSELSTLDSFTFEVKSPAGPLFYQGSVYQWTGNTIAGDALFTSAVQQIPKSFTYFAQTVSTGGIALMPGQQYLLIFSTVGVDSSANGQALFGKAPDASYPGGSFEYNNANNFLSLFTGDPGWNDNGSFGDLAFSADFSAQDTPEPSTLWLATIAASTGLLVAARKRRLKLQTIALRRITSL